MHRWVCVCICVCENIICNKNKNNLKIGLKCWPKRGGVSIWAVFNNLQRLPPNKSDQLKKKSLPVFNSSSSRPLMHFSTHTYSHTGGRGGVFLSSVVNPQRVVGNSGGLYCNSWQGRQVFRRQELGGEFVWRLLPFVGLFWDSVPASQNQTCGSWTHGGTLMNVLLLELSKKPKCDS